MQASKPSPPANTEFENAKLTNPEVKQSAICIVPILFVFIFETLTFLVSPPEPRPVLLFPSSDYAFLRIDSLSVPHFHYRLFILAVYLIRVTESFTGK
jgi:hypothetical protein